MLYTILLHNIAYNVSICSFIHHYTHALYTVYNNLRCPTPFIFRPLCSGELLTELLSSADLFVMQVEMDAYTLAKKVDLMQCCMVLCHDMPPSPPPPPPPPPPPLQWLFLACNPGWVGDLTKLGSDADHFFKIEGGLDGVHLE